MQERRLPAAIEVDVEALAVLQLADDGEPGIDVGHRSSLDRADDVARAQTEHLREAAGAELDDLPASVRRLDADAPGCALRQRPSQRGVVEPEHPVGQTERVCIVRDRGRLGRLRGFIRFGRGRLDHVDGRRYLDRRWRSVALPIARSEPCRENGRASHPGDGDPARRGASSVPARRARSEARSATRPA